MDGFASVTTQLIPNLKKTVQSECNMSGQLCANMDFHEVLKTCAQNHLYIHISTRICYAKFKDLLSVVYGFINHFPRDYI
uniref:Uncharacterized protein n=1 Tax=Pyxicephalus adspersus TaxID=30357 RepID=A0AAV3B163_PYXAD|nr:TPA: hypothetical protein GDO54_008713 [Pyxicephalus adspersus]